MARPARPLRKGRTPKTRRWTILSYTTNNKSRFRLSGCLTNHLEVNTLAKIVRCREVGVDCDFEARGETEQEGLNKAAEKGRTAEGMQELSPEVVARVRAGINAS